MKEYLSLGTILDAFRLDGTMKVYSTTYFAEERYLEGNKLFLISKDGNDIKEVTVKSYRPSGDLDFVQFEEITTPEEVKDLKGYSINILKDEANLPKDMYLFSDLENCKVYDEENNFLGKVKKVEEFPAQITLRCERAVGADFLVPFINEFVLEVDIKNKSIKIKVIPGLL